MMVDKRRDGVVPGRFGKDVRLMTWAEGQFTVNVDVHVSGQFLGWSFSLGEQVKRLSPEGVAEQMKREAERLMRQYG